MDVHKPRFIGSGFRLEVIALSVNAVTWILVVAGWLAAAEVTERTHVLGDWRLGYAVGQAVGAALPWVLCLSVVLSFCSAATCASGKRGLRAGLAVVSSVLLFVAAVLTPAVGHS